MELSNHKRSLEDSKYIYVSNFIELITFSNKPSVKISHIATYLIDKNFDQQVTSYFSHNGKSYSKDLHRDNFGFDLNTREFLRQCDSSEFILSKYFTYSDEDNLDDNFLYLIDELQSIECIKNLNINFDSSVMFQVSEASRKYNDDLNPYIFRLSDSMDLEVDNPFRDKLAVLDNYSVIHAACLLSGDSPTEIEQFKNHLDFSKVFSKYISFKLMIELAIKNDELDINNDRILAIDLKEYLGKNGYFFRGFNDWMAIEPAKPLNNYKTSQKLEIDTNRMIVAQARIVELETELAQVKAQLKEQTDKPAHAAIDEGQGDTLLILGAVMDCIERVAKPNYTQQLLITAITDKYKNTSSLTYSTLTKKFPKAKTYLKQNVTL